METNSCKYAKSVTLEVALSCGPYATQAATREIKLSFVHTLLDLHEIIMEAYGRTDRQSFEFNFGNSPFCEDGRYTDPVEKASLSEQELFLDQVFYYWFDFAEDWIHTIRVKKIEATTHPLQQPRIIKKEGEVVLEPSLAATSKPAVSPRLSGFSIYPCYRGEDPQIQSILHGMAKESVLLWKKAVEDKSLPPDRNFSDALDKLPLSWLQGICLKIGLPPHLIVNNRLEAIVSHLLNERTIEELWSRLPAGSKEMLIEIIQEHGGEVSMHDLCKKRVIEKDLSWFWDKGDLPTTDFGILQSTAFVFVGRGSKKEQRTKMVMVPVELRPFLKKVIDKEKVELSS